MDDGRGKTHCIFVVSLISCSVAACFLVGSPNAAGCISFDSPDEAGCISFDSPNEAGLLLFGASSTCSCVQLLKMAPTMNNNNV